MMTIIVVMTAAFWVGAFVGAIATNEDLSFVLALPAIITLGIIVVLAVEGFKALTAH